MATNLTAAQRRKRAYQRLGRKYKPGRFEASGGLAGVLEPFSEDRQEVATGLQRERTGGVQGRQVRRSFRKHMESQALGAEAAIRPKAGPGFYPKEQPQVGREMMAGPDFNALLRQLPSPSRQQTQAIDTYINTVTDPQQRKEVIQFFTSRPEFSNWMQQSRFANAPGGPIAATLATMTGVQATEARDPLAYRKETQLQDYEVRQLLRNKEEQKARTMVLGFNAHQALREGAAPDSEDYILSKMSVQHRRKVDDLKELLQNRQIDTKTAWDGIQDVMKPYLTGESIREEQELHRAATKKAGEERQAGMLKEQEEAKATDVAIEKEKQGEKKAEVDAYAKAMGGLADTMDNQLAEAQKTLKALEGQLNIDMLPDEMAKDPGYKAAQTAVREIVKKQAEMRILLAKLHVVAVIGEQEELDEVINEVRKVVGLEPRAPEVVATKAPAIEPEPTLAAEVAPGAREEITTAIEDATAAPSAEAVEQLPKPTKPGQKITPNIAVVYLRWADNDQQKAEAKALEDGWKL